MDTTNPATPPPPKRRGPRLATAANLRAYVGNVIRRVELGIEPSAPLDPARARLLVYAASVLGSLVTASSFEERIRVLELAQAEAGREERPGLAS